MNKLLPTPFLDLIATQLPAHLSLDDLITACHQPLRFSIRVNTIKIDCQAFIDLMSPYGWSFTPINWCKQGFWVDINNDETAPGKLPEHLAGLFYIQEASSMLPPVALFDAINAPATFNNVLDLAAAPGSKTTQIAALMNNKGLLIANEFSSSRIKALHSNLTRLGITNTLISHFDGSVHGDYLENSFDAILVDAPCSGEGTVRKDKDAFKNWNIEHVQEVSELQTKLIISAFMALKPGGELVYSTCALNAIENQQVCQQLLEKFAGNIEVVNLGNLFDGADKALTDEGYLHIWPQIYNSEGFFVAKFKKLTASNLSKQPQFKSRLPYSPLSKKQSADILAILETQLDCTHITADNLMQRDQDIWFFPNNHATFTAQMRFVRHGIKLLEIKPKHSQISHEALTAFGHQTLLLNRLQLVDYYRGKDLAISNDDKQKGEVLLSYQECCIGLGKWVGNKIKNKLPRQLVNDHVTIK
ncbi:MAG: 16S rRNA (cytosine(1407)-C(5))-methyltransferase RsmF [Psychrobium sp.]|nr:16S rRNA (cytosine(1407)-C(5))-methyltransferase RsmF [Psychrobium sp.]